MGLRERFFPQTEQLVLVPGVIECTILPRFKVMLLFIADNITDDGPYEDLAKRLLKSGYTLHIFQLPVKKVE